jgi:2-polyprenyl-6-methoxyphenol hydroxylase-like FAD-dependent oxidoreductase
MQTGLHEVVIVGAGPTGLTLACLLARSNVDFRIIDAASEPPAGSRGKGLQPRSVELFDDLGVAAQIIGHGVFGLKVRHYDENGAARVEEIHETISPRPDASYLQALILPQWRVEEVLRARLAELGRTVEFGFTLTGFSQDEDAVTAEVSGPDGVLEIKARWLVGCDGGKSMVRHLAGINFMGETLETHRMLLGDWRVSGLDREHWHIWRSAEGFLALCPLPSTEAFQFQASVAPGQDPSTAVENYREVLARRTGRGDITISEPGWRSLWRANIRMVDHYREKRVFLAGDAAHVHSPAAGQGMNTGIQDAFNLGWKLAAVANGADEKLLESYQEERLPIAAGVLGVSTELMQAAVAAGTFVFRRDAQTLQLGLNYRQSGLTRELRGEVEGLRGGDRAPEAPGLVGADGLDRMFDLLRGRQVTLLGFWARWQELIASCEARFPGRLKGYVIVDRPGDPRHVVDAAGHARAAYGEDALFVVRPDNYVGLATRDADVETVIGYLGQILAVA